MKTIKERALELLRQFPLQYLAPVKLHEVCNELESVLKTLAYAPEPEPVAHAVILPNGMTRIWFSDRDSGELWRARERVEQELTPLYTAPPAPSVPDGWRLVPYTPTVLMLERAEYAVNNRPQPSKYEPSATPAIIFWTAMLNYAPEAPQDAEPSADVVRDAERLDWLLRKLPGVVLRYCVGVLSDTSDRKEFREAIDAAIKRQGGE